MNTELQVVCKSSISDLDLLENNCVDQFDRIDELLLQGSSDFESGIEPVDIAFPMIYGAAGAFISSSEKLKKFLDDIHAQASKENPKSFLGKIFNHYDHRIDMADKNGQLMFIKRDGMRPEVGSHRLMYGHDPFSFFNGDNPFKILTDQYGILKGVVKVFQHLSADTFSKQGLPIPFHSYFDFYKDGKLSNHLWQFAKKCSNGVKKADGSPLRHTEAFDQLFTIKASDIMTTGLTWVLCLIHNRIRGFEDPVFKSQTQIIGLSSQFFSKVIIGYMKTGAPYISWPTLTLLLKQIYTFARANWADIKRLEKITDQLLEKNRALEAEILGTGTGLQSYETPGEYIQELEDQYTNFDQLTAVFEE